MASRGAQPGNKNAAKGKLWFDAVYKHVAQDKSALPAIVDVVVNAAKAGEAWAVTELRNTLDGKPVQQIEHSGDMSFTKTVRDLTDDELARVVLEARAGKEPDTDGQTLQ